MVLYGIIKLIDLNSNPKEFFKNLLFPQRNGTDRIMGHFNMYTGEGDINKIGKMGEWNYSNRTSYFPDHCGMVNGSAGEFYPPNQTKNKPISFFSPDMCRTIPLDFEEESIVHNMMGYKYTGGPKTVDNGSVYPDNWCFSTGDIVPSGVLNISACRHNTPVFMSFPHYYGADPYYLNMVEGLNPIKEKHQFYMTLDPVSCANFWKVSNILNSCCFKFQEKYLSVF